MEVAWILVLPLDHFCEPFEGVGAAPAFCVFLCRDDCFDVDIIEQPLDVAFAQLAFVRQ